MEVQMANGVMIAVYPPAVVRRALALPRGVDPSEIHLTLAYLGEEGDVDPDALAALPNELKRLYTPFEGVECEISGFGRFFGTGLDPVWASVDSANDRLQWLRDEIVSALDRVGIPLGSRHGFTPHLTLAWIDASEPTPELPREVAGTRFTVDRISLVVSDERRDFYYEPESDVVALSAPVDADGNERTPIELTGPFVKKDARQQIAYAAVLVPGEGDFDGDVLTSEKIEEVAHGWMAQYRNIDLGHSLNNVNAVPVESFLTQEDQTVTFLSGEDVTLPAGSWILASKVMDADVWAGIESGEYTGYSIMGVRRAAMKGKEADMELFASKARRTTLADLGPDWIAPFVSIVDNPAVPKAKFFALKSDTVVSETELAKKFADALGFKEEPTVDPEQVTAAVKEAITPLIDRVQALEAAAKADDSEDNIDTGAQIDQVAGDPDNDTEDAVENPEDKPPAGEAGTGSASVAGRGDGENTGENTTVVETDEVDDDKDKGELASAKPGGEESELHAQKDAEIAELQAKLAEKDDEIASIKSSMEEFQTEVLSKLPKPARKSILGQDGAEDDTASTKSSTLEDEYDLHGRRRR